MVADHSQVFFNIAGVGFVLLSDASYVCGNNNTGDETGYIDANVVRVELEGLSAHDRHRSFILALPPSFPRSL